MARKVSPDALAKKARLTHTEWAGLCSGRIERLHFQRAAIQKIGNRLVMTGRSGEHSIQIDESDLDRVNAHWTCFATNSANLF